MKIKKLISMMLCGFLVISATPSSAISTITEITKENKTINEEKLSSGSSDQGSENVEQEGSNSENTEQKPEGGVLEGEKPEQKPEEELSPEILPSIIPPLEILPEEDYYGDPTITPEYPEIQVAPPSNRLRSTYKGDDQVVFNPEEKILENGTKMRKSIKQTEKDVFEITLEVVVKEKPAESKPVDVVLVIDASNSMTKEMLDNIKKAAENFVPTPKS